MGKTPIDIEKLLQWAYREELPKQAVSGLTGWERLIYLGTVVDSSHDPTSLYPAAMGAPDPDALAVDWTVRQSLPESVGCDWPRLHLRIMGELQFWLSPQALASRTETRIRARVSGGSAQATRTHVVVAAMQAQPRALVQAHARMGSRPVWDVGAVRVVRRIGRNGKPVVEGISRGGRYGVGARCPLDLDPAPEEIAAARYEYHVWHQALTALANESWNLRGFAPQPPAAAPAPWLTGPERHSRVLRSPAATLAKIPLAPKRRYAGQFTYRSTSEDA